MNSQAAVQQLNLHSPAPCHCSPCKESETSSLRAGHSGLPLPMVPPRTTTHKVMTMLESPSGFKSCLSQAGREDTCRAASSVAPAEGALPSPSSCDGPCECFPRMGGPETFPCPQGFPKALVGALLMVCCALRPHRISARFLSENSFWSQELSTRRTGRGPVFSPSSLRGSGRCLWLAGCDVSMGRAQGWHRGHAPPQTGHAQGKLLS